MISFSELKQAVSKISETELIINAENEKKGRFRFKRNNDSFSIQTMKDNDISKANLRLTRLIRFPTDKKITKEEGEIIEATMNLISDTPCKTTYIYDEQDNLDGRFFITNIYTDKLNQFEKFKDENVKISKLVVVILSMIFETALCIQEILTQVDEVVEVRVEKGEKDGK